MPPSKEGGGSAEPGVAMVQKHQLTGEQSMEYMQVKGLNKAVSKVVMGSAGGSPGFLYEQQELFDEMCDIYMAAGGNMIDTGRMYGTGNASEALVANWIHKRKARDRMFITNKCCSPYRDRHGVMDESRPRVHPELITEDLICSLDRMEFDHFDCYLLHRDNPEIPIPDIMDRLEYHRTQGRITAYGVSNWSTNRINEAIAYCEKMKYQGISVNEPSYSLATVKECRWPNTVYINDEEARMFTDMGLNVISFSPVGGGFFAGAFFKDDAIVTEGTRKAYFNDENMEKYKRAEQIGKEHGTDAVSIALSYIASQDLLLAPIIGPRTPDEYKSCLNATSLRLTPAEIEYLSLRSDSY